ncbi:serine hydrolase domain-containing protein [Kribbella sandramycini]
MVREQSGLGKGTAGFCGAGSRVRLIGMRRSVGVVGLVVGALVGAPLSAEAGRGGLQRELDGVVGVAGVGAQVEVREGRRVWRGRSGVGEVGTGRAVPLAGRFRVGSVTKTFVATAVLQLVGEGRVGLEDPVLKWLPGVRAEGVTVRQLLDHTSGLYDVLNTLPRPPEAEFYANRWRTWTADELIARALVHPPTSKPGVVYKYSNTNYLLLGEIVEKATGVSYAEAVERRVIRPLRLRDTYFPGTSTAIQGPHAHGYVPGPDGPLIDYTKMNPSVFGAAGELISSTRDLDTFMTALLGGRLLSPELLRAMRTPGVEGGRYGLGLTWRTTTCGTTVYGNDGDALAYQTWVFSTADRRQRVALLLTPNFDVDSDDVVDAFLDKAFCG